MQWNFYILCFLTLFSCIARWPFGSDVDSVVFNQPFSANLLCAFLDFSFFQCSIREADVQLAIGSRSSGFHSSTINSPCARATMRRQCPRRATWKIASTTSCALRRPIRRPRRPLAAAGSRSAMAGSSASRSSCGTSATSSRPPSSTPIGATAEGCARGGRTRGRTRRGKRPLGRTMRPRAAGASAAAWALGKSLGQAGSPGTPRARASARARARRRGTRRLGHWQRMSAIGGAVVASGSSGRTTSKTKNCAAACSAAPFFDCLAASSDVCAGGGQVTVTVRRQQHAGHWRQK